ncbi:unnamed protein product [Spirodela intermedia]|uniref:RING-type E3 ubiquitin transferase n=1 Tax=Spirodela intermedia TaxID=51605 RepID=A0A7I8IAF3_SPIIN|nr:unnamed protein product [Spirodela intermedia]CAA6654639.1 unnamed protein product [Spirodela intermedia]
MAISSRSARSPEGDSPLLQSLLGLSREISLCEPPLRQRRRARSAARKARILSLLFEELLCAVHPAGDLPRSAVLWLREIFVVLRRFKRLLDSCSDRMSRVSLVLGLESVAGDFHELTRSLSRLLCVFPVSDLGLGEDSVELVELLQKQCRRSSAAVDPEDEELRSEILEMLENMFERLGVNDFMKLCKEIERLEVEIPDRVDPNRTARMTALLGLLRYGKCVLFGASPAPGSHLHADHGGFETSDAAVPADFRCPISLDLMRDPVVVSSGQTYDRESISGWIASGHATCPKSGQVLSNSRLIPNRALRNIIHQWCGQHGVPFDAPEYPEVSVDPDRLRTSKAVVEAVKMTTLFFLRKLEASPSAESANKIVHELRQMAKSSSDNRAFIAEAGAVPLLASLLESNDAHLQVNAITALLNLSILPVNKRRIMLAAGGLDGLVYVLRSGRTWQAKENAAATLLSLSTHHASYRRKVAMTAGVAEGLAELVRSGPASSQRDGLVAMLNLAGDKDNIGRLVEGGVVEAALEATAVPEVAEIALTVVAAVAKRGGAAAVGTDRAKETAAAALVSVCPQGGEAAVAELTAISGIECAIWNLMRSGSERGSRTAASLGRMCRRWAVVAPEE